MMHISTFFNVIYSFGYVFMRTPNHATIPYNKDLRVSTFYFHNLLINIRLSNCHSDFVYSFKFFLLNIL